MGNQSQPLERTFVPPAKVKYDPVARQAETCDFPVPKLHATGRLECRCCHEVLPHNCFQNLEDPFCTDCRVKKSEGELNELRAKLCSDFSHQMQLADQGRIPLDKLESFLAELVYDFGGMRLFVKCWADQLKQAIERNPGSIRVLDHFPRIAKLVLDCNKLQHQEDLLDLSDEQLRFQKEQALLEMLNSAAVDPHRRQLLVQLLRSGGVKLSEIPGLPLYAEVATHAG